MRLYNTLTRTKDTLRPLTDDTVTLYTCGLTVYSQPHIGNWIAYIYWDVLVRTLQDAGYNVTRTQNITDVGHLVSDDDTGEDKMEKGAQREGITAWDVAKKYSDIAEHQAYDLLGLIRPDNLVRATDYINQQIAFAQALESRGFTYVIPGEGLYFDTSKLPDYGRLARLDTDGLEAGARVAVNGKRHATDFAVWKFSPAGAKRDMEWWAPWGGDNASSEKHPIGMSRNPLGSDSTTAQAEAVHGSWGFPGWHLECSVIARETLGDQIDIHTGGIDHIPVHHTNEIAQTEAVTGKSFANIWLHNNHLKVDGGKMSKSLGNTYTLEDIDNHGYDIMAYKLLILSKHYRTEGNFTWENLEAAQHVLDKFNAWSDLQFQQLESTDYARVTTEKLQKIREALRDDLGTQQAITIINELITASEHLGPDAKAIKAATEVIQALLGLPLHQRQDISADQQQLLQQRQAARHAKDWALSDKLRDQLAEQGIGVLDTADGMRWHRLRD